MYTYNILFFGVETIHDLPESTSLEFVLIYYVQ